MADMLNNYVKFLRGTPSAYEALTSKDKDTLYFISGVDQKVGKLYLGDILVAGNVTPDGDSIIDSLGELTDVNLKGLVEGQVLGFNGAEWVPMDLSKACECSEMIGASSTADGAAGYVPAPKIGDQNKFLRGDGTWAKVDVKPDDYKITSGLFEDTLVDYREKEIRIMFTENSPYVKQQVGANGNPNMYYMGFKAYAPEDATHFKEDTAEVIKDNTLYDFNGPFSGIEPDGRKYSICWLAVALYDATSDTWTYYGKNSTTDKYIGWYYSVEWYKNDTVIKSDTIRINLANEECFNELKPFYMADYTTKEAFQAVETKVLDLENIGAEKNIINSVDVATLNVTEDRKLELKAVPQNIVTGLTKTSWTVQEVEDGDDIFIAHTAVASLEDILKPATFDPTTKTGTTGLMTAEQVQKLQALVITDEGVQISGKVNADNVEGLGSWITTNRNTIEGLYPVEAKNLLDSLNKLVTDETNGLSAKIDEHDSRIAEMEEAMTWGSL